MKCFVACLISLLLCVPVSVRAEVIVPAQGRRVVPFEGTLDFQAMELSMAFGRLPEGTLGVKVSKVAPGRYSLHADIRHMMTPLCDVAAALDGKFEIVGREYARRELQGEVSTQYTLLNYKPVRDLYVKFAVRERRLIIDPFWFGFVSGRGKIDLTGDHTVDAGLDLVSTDLEEIWEMLRARGITPPPLSGIVTGAVSLKGPVARLSWGGALSAYNGRLKDFDYERISVRFEGQYPMLRLIEGAVVSPEGPRFKVEGALDLSDMTRITTQMHQLKRDFVVSESDSGRAWTLNRLSDHPEQSTQLKSFISGDVDGRGESSSAIGLQKHIGF